MRREAAQSRSRADNIAESEGAPATDVDRFGCWLDGLTT